MIKDAEGLRLEAYQDCAGIWTIGYGTTFYEDGSKVKKGDKITRERAEELHDWYIASKITLPSMELTEPQRRALQSLIYNIGQNGFNSSTLKKRLLEGASKEEVEEAWLRWNKVRDKKTGKLVASKGLTNRRQAEVDLYFS